MDWCVKELNFMWISCSKRIINFYKLALIYILITGFFLVDKVSAEECVEGKLCNPVEADSFHELIARLLEFAFGISGLVLVLIILYSAIVITTSGGNSEKVAKARSMIKWGIIGFILIISSYTLLSVVVGLF